jgi:hypothetical protein
VPNGLTRYEIPGCKREQYRILPVQGAWAFFSEVDQVGNRDVLRVFHSARKIATELVQRWRGGNYDNQPGSFGIAVMEHGDYQIVEDGGEQVVKPTQEFLQKLIIEQAKRARYLIEHGSNTHEKDPTTVTENHRRAALFLLGEDAPQWAKGFNYNTVKACYACGEQVKMAALRCKHCNVDFPQYLRENKMSALPEDTAVKAQMEVLFRPGGHKGPDIAAVEAARDAPSSEAFTDAGRMSTRAKVAAALDAHAREKAAKEQAKRDEEAARLTRHGAANQPETSTLDRAMEELVGASR